jgi:hypothetical protein
LEEPGGFPPGNFRTTLRSRNEVLELLLLSIDKQSIERSAQGALTHVKGNLSAKSHLFDWRKLDCRF